MKSKFKFLITSFVLLILFLNSFCFAADTNYETMLISDTTHYQESTTTDSDLYIIDSEYEISNTVNGNVFATVDNLNINPSGIIKGNLFITADNVNIKSDVVYSDTEKDELGNPVLTINKVSSVSGNAFIVADKFVLNPGCEINGDLYICANEVCLEQNSKVTGNLFVCSNKFALNAEIGGSLYATVQEFDMQYFAFISRDLHLAAEEVNLNGWIYRNSFITAKNITTQNKFINQGNFTVTDADNLTFSGEISGNATINVKNLDLKNKDNDTNLTCKISGNLSYSSSKEIEIPEGIVSKEVSYSTYINKISKSIFSSIWDYILSLITLLVCVYIIYLLISKFASKYLNKISNISGLSLLKYLGIGLGFLILIPIISILLLITGVGSILGLIILLIYIILLLIAKPIFIISIATFAKNKIPNKFNVYLYILAVTVILSLISLIPYLGSIISMLVYFTGFGMIVKNLIPNKKDK